MKRLLNYCILTCMIFLMASCGNSEEKNVKDFALNFGEMVKNNDANAIRNVYPDLGDYSSCHLSFYRDDVDIFPEENGKYKVRYGDGAYIIVRTGLDGAMEVVDSKGIFEKNTVEQNVEVAEPRKPKEPKEPKPEPQRSGPSAFSDGYNVLTGAFNYKGADYGFTVSFTYDTSTGKVRDAVYYADYNSAGARNPISSMVVSANERNITIKGPKLSIKVSGSPGSYSGSMTRGTHSGTCRMWL